MRFLFFGMKKMYANQGKLPELRNIELVENHPLLKKRIRKWLQKRKDRLSKIESGEKTKFKTTKERAILNLKYMIEKIESGKFVPERIAEKWQKRKEKMEKNIFFTKSKYGR